MFVRMFVNRLFRLHYPRARRFLVYGIGGAGTATGGTTLAFSLFEPTDRSKKDAAMMTEEMKDLQAIREADAFYDKYILSRAYDILKRYKSSTHPEHLWRLARVLCDMGKMEKTSSEKKRLFSEALEVAQKALDNELNGKHGQSFGAHKWYAIALNYYSEQQGSKAQIKSSPDVKAHLEQALQINPQDATTWHILGVWHFSFADLSSYQRFAASAFFGTPPTSSYEEALRHFERAEAIHPNFYSANAYYLGLCLERLNRDNAKVMEWFKKAFAAPVLTADDMTTHEKVADHLCKKYGFNNEKLYALMHS